VGTTGDLTVIAIWDPVPILYSITYVLDGGVNAPGNPSEYAVTSSFPVEIADPSRGGSLFLGWVVVYSNGTIVPMAVSYGVPAGSACDVTLTAVWGPVVVLYAVDYVLGVGGVNGVGNPVSYSAGVLPFVLVSPVRDGYVFSHWVMTCADGSSSVLVGGVVPVGTLGDVTLTAVWDAAVVYSVDYLLAGGVNGVGNPLSYTVEESFPISIANPVLPGKAFLYWIAIYADNSVGILPSAGIAPGTTGNITLIAVWYP
jgi:hypothetical protein